MEQKRIHFPRTTAAQRKLLFQTWEETGNVGASCLKAHVCRQTFYNWKPCFDAAGYAGLEQFGSSAPKKPAHTSSTIEQRVIEMRNEHSDWGKRRIADELAKDNHWERVIAPNTVRRILKDAHKWDAETENKPVVDPVVRTAEEPGQTSNVDLCFVPATHNAEVKLPAVSGSSGRLVVERPKEAAPSYPGQVFAQPDLEYAQAMHQFRAASSEQTVQAMANTQSATDESGRTATVREQKRALRQTEAELRVQRRQVRERRKQEDAAWHALRERRRTQQAVTTPSTPTDSAPPVSDIAWRQLRQQHREQLCQRQQEDARWREQRNQLKQQLATLPIVTIWVAILLIVDNCTRQCLGLPLFTVGAHVTAEMIVAALQVLLPADLQFLISDRGVHFTAQVFKELASNAGFVHILIARHRPQSNGIAERFVRTLKEWLATHSWKTEVELLALLAQFREEYNDRPHQGLPIPGLSPNEFAKRIGIL
jgi:transposase InsO family protein